MTMKMPTVSTRWRPCRTSAMTAPLMPMVSRPYAARVTGVNAMASPLG